MSANDSPAGDREYVLRRGGRYLARWVKGVDAYTVDPREALRFTGKEQADEGASRARALRHELVVVRADKIAGRGRRGGRGRR